MYCCEVPTNLVTFASDAPLQFAPPRDPTPGAAPLEGSTDQLFAQFETWLPLELQAATDAQEGRVLTDAALQAEAPAAAARRTTEPVVSSVEAAEAAAAPAAAAALGLYGAERAALEVSMAALQRQAMPEEAWALVHETLSVHRRRLGAHQAERLEIIHQAPSAEGEALIGEKGEL